MIRRRSRTARGRMARVMIARERRANLRIARQLLRIARMFAAPENIVEIRKKLNDRIPEIIRESVTAACDELAGKVAANRRGSETVDKVTEVIIPEEIKNSEVSEGSIGIRTYISYNGSSMKIDAQISVNQDDYDGEIKSNNISCESIRKVGNDISKLKSSLVGIITKSFSSEHKRDILFTAIQRNYGFPYSDDMGKLLGKKSEGGKEKGDTYDHLTRNEDDTDETMMGFHDEDDDEYGEEGISKPMRRKKKTYGDRLNEMPL